jgi:ABC-type antimicrobial peptide transport system permease subunit
VQEIGVRMALGAPIASVLRMVVVERLKPTMAGIVIGVAAAMALGGVMSALVYGITTHDGATFMSVALIIMVVGAVASLVPAYRATRFDPLVALRNE